MRDTTSFTEGENCFTITYTEDYREIATVIVLKGGKDAVGTDITALVQDEVAIKKYGRRSKIISETQWTTQVLCELRALQLLANYSKPAIVVQLDAEPEPLGVGASVNFKSTTLDVDDIFAVQSVTYESSGGESMTVELTNRLVTLADILSALERQFEKR